MFDDDGIFFLLLSQRLDDTTPLVRDAACEVIGTLLKALGDRPMVAYTEGIDKTKMAKASSDKEMCPFLPPPLETLD